MARPKVDSLTYYNQDTKDDDNLQYVEAMHSFKGYAIIHKLWKHIYGSPGGYFCPWDKKNKIIFCQNARITVDELDAIIETCYEDGIQIFDRGMTDKYGILTSKGIQKRWLRIVKECGRTRCIIDEKYNLLPLTTIKQLESAAAVEFTGRKPEENQTGEQINTDESTQIKEKEIKENNIKKANFKIEPLTFSQCIEKMKSDEKLKEDNYFINKIPLTDFNEYLEIFARTKKTENERERVDYMDKYKYFINWAGFYKATFEKNRGKNSLQQQTRPKAKLL